MVVRSVESGYFTGGGFTGKREEAMEFADTACIRAMFEMTWRDKLEFELVDNQEEIQQIG